jgi:DNA replication protein DnaC
MALAREPTRKTLTPLGFHGLAAQAETLLHEPWLAQLLDIEQAERQRRSLKRRLDEARLGTFKPWADCDWSWPTEGDRPLSEETFALGFIKAAANGVFIGGNGLGKTMLAKKLVYQAVLQGYTARFTTASDRLHELAAPASSSALARRLRRYLRPPILALD